MCVYSMYSNLQENAKKKPAVLATFECSLSEFVSPFLDSVMGVDLLMEPTKDFPGIISPKV